MMRITELSSHKEYPIHGFASGVVVLVGIVFTATLVLNCAKDVEKPKHYEPDIEITPTNLAFVVLKDSTASDTLTIDNVGDALLTVTSISDTASWLSFSPTSFSLEPESSRDVIATVDGSNMDAGHDSVTVTIGCDDPDEGTVPVPVVLTVELPPTPDITVSPTSFALNVLQGGSVDTVVVVENVGTATLQVMSITDDSSWLGEDPTNFSVAVGSTQDVTVTVDATNLSVGQYSGIITIASNDPDEGQVTVTVSLMVELPPTPDITVSSTSFALNALQGGSVDTVIVVENVGTATLQVMSITDDSSWLGEDPTNFSVAVGSTQDVTVTVDATSLSVGQHSGIITIASNDPDEGQVTVTVSLMVELPPTPDITVSPTSFALNVLQGGSVDTVVVVENVGTATLQVMSITDDSSWLGEDPTNFSVAVGSTQDVTVTVDATSLSVGQHSGIITIASNDPDEGQVTVSVSLMVELPPTPDITVSPTSFALNVLQGGSVDTVVVVENVGTATLQVMSITDDSSWLGEDPTNFSVAVGSTQDVTVTVDATSLSVGQYSGIITIASNDPDEGQVTMPVTVTVQALLAMVSLTGGTFQMGSESDWAESDEQPVHPVTIRAFSMGKYEVTNEEMRKVMQWACVNDKVDASSETVTNAEGSAQELLDLDDSDCEISFSGGTFTIDSGKEDHPCMEVTWYGGQAFCNYLSDMEGFERCISFTDWSCTWSADGYRLPTEAEWEYACRAGTTTDYYSGDETEGDCSYDPNLDAIGWYCYNASWTEEVGRKQASDWGLYDMSGNVWEWCWDRYGQYSSEAQTDPTGPTSGPYRLLRGGSWYYYAEYCRSAYRYEYDPINSDYNLGFRPVRR